MRLLAKSEIAQAKAKDKQREINEGLKISRSVDTLRELHADEEASLEKFRQTKIGEMAKEFTEWEEKTAKLKEEVPKLEKRKAEALVPLQDEWEKLSKVEEGLEKDRRELEEREKELGSQETEARELLKQAKEDSKAAKVAFREAQVTLARANDKSEKAKGFLELSTRIRKESESEIMKATRALSTREEQVKGQEKGLVLREKVLSERELELNARETRLNDRIATLERTIKRNG